MKEKDVHLFNGDELLAWLIDIKAFNFGAVDESSMIDDSTKYNWDWCKDNVKQLINVDVCNISCTLTGDGYGRFHCDLTADVIAKEK